ncbi:MAG: hypothetical protein RBS19_05920 [Bacteroidales bacterium]|nr:hypothetical protein [Bacteroidales bacterium]MDY0216473.1 hypothetical protein [Bacteroidales bacterium]
MKVYNNLKEIAAIKNPVVTIGSFDGVHVAHRLILKRIIKLAKEIDGESVILTFDPHPREFLNPDLKIELLNTKEEKIQLLEKIGIDNVVFIPFTLEFSKITSRDFIYRILHQKLNAKKIVIGYNHFFGHNREGGFDVLYNMGRNLGFTVEEIPEQDIQNESISSSKIRNALEVGDLIKAHAYLHYDYSISGQLMEGEPIFSEFGYRSWLLNINNTKKLIPGEGLYYANVLSNDRLWESAIMIKKDAVIEEKSIHILLVGDDSTMIHQKVEIIFKHMVRKCPEDNDCNDLKRILEAIIIKAGNPF